MVCQAVPKLKTQHFHEIDHSLNLKSFLHLTRQHTSHEELGCHLWQNLATNQAQ